MRDFKEMVKGLEKGQIIHYNNLLQYVWKSDTKIRNRQDFINGLKMILGMPYKEVLEVYYIDYDGKHFNEIKIGEIELLTCNALNMTKILNINSFQGENNV